MHEEPTVVRQHALPIYSDPELDAAWREFVAEERAAHGPEIIGLELGSAFIYCYRLLRVRVLMDEGGFTDWNGIPAEEVNALISRISWMVGGFAVYEEELTETMMSYVKARVQTLNSMPYGDYLQTPEWQDVRHFARRRAQQRCQVCNSDKRLQVHHRTYDRRGAENLSDVTVLCQRHHHGFHQTGGLVR
jgi:hypothetical protein